MISRRTEIVDFEIDDTKEQQDEIFSQLSLCLLEEKRLLKRFFDFSDQYNNFEYDEMGINMDEAYNISRKANKIRDLILFNIEEKLAYNFNDIQSDIVSKSITMNLNVEEKKYTIVVEVKSDSFNLEVY